MKRDYGCDDLFERCRHRDDQLVIAALKVRCTVCKAAPGVDCRNPWASKTPMDRIVHLCRAQGHMRVKTRPNWVENGRDTPVSE